MEEPNWEKVTEEDLWKFVGWHLANKGISSVLVGGSVVSIYSKGAYRSGDLDMVEPLISRGKEIRETMEALNFKKFGRHYRHPMCAHLFVEFVSSPVSIGDDYRIKPDEIEVDGKILRILSPTDCVKDRLASFFYFKSRDCLDQAVLVASNQRIYFDKVKEWCLNEPGAGIEGYLEFEKALKIFRNNA
ncbi:hypothetical protein [Leptospira sp. GIMC2001]|uniref:hypothetical protein n=1 Tax=Leptospira sp. GIMC2001 TaxID=1513297 RepID=UPI00234AFA52|nr:hypothetical protein [Leptospira sp. GIMC2001]WCL50686.1 hypothetical protein O4O04_07710 [Leptospira sp. GIMC2001]WCL50792.1 hypothetical protein O4O04_08260 [Leptospira sp. GIMC2001]WCL50815.1 hypothetical protein O4O04_08380 [Leptospira sp. GIMC2001]